jgi:hypothetical protein
MSPPTGATVPTTDTIPEGTQLIAVVIFSKPEKKNLAEESRDRTSCLQVGLKCTRTWERIAQSIHEVCLVALCFVGWTPPLGRFGKGYDVVSTSQNCSQSSF